MKNVLRTWGECFKLFKDNPKVLFPLILLAFVNCIALYLLYLAPQRPVSAVLAPPIVKFFGQQYTQYPFNLLLLPRLLSYAQIVINATAGILMMAVTVQLLSAANRGEKVSLSSGIVKSIRRYGGLLLIWLCMFIPAFLLIKFGTKPFTAVFGPALPYMMYCILVCIQLVFIYAIPALILKQKSFFTALKVNFIFLKRNIRESFLFVFIPVCVYLPVIFIKQHLTGLVRRTSPESIVVVLLAGIALTFLIDVFLTAAPALFFLKGEREGI